VEGRGQRTPVRLSVDEHDTTGSRLGMAGGLKDLARQWYGKAGIKYASAAAIEKMLISLAVQLSDPGTTGHSLFVTGTGATTAVTGCTRDTDCKGERICVEAVCTDP
jgi:hypothetical protein